MLLIGKEHNYGNDIIVLQPLIYSMLFYIYILIKLKETRRDNYI